MGFCYKYVKVTDSTVLSADAIAKMGTLYADFTEENYTITYDLNGGNWTTDYTAPKTYQCDAGIEINKDKLKKGSGSYYEFKGWYVNGDETKIVTNDALNAVNTYTGNITLKAVWDVASSATDKGVINIDTNDGTIYKTTLADGSVTKYVDESTTLSLDGDKNTDIADGVVDDAVITIGSEATYTLAKAGYRFGGWYADEDCTVEFTFDKYPDGTETTAYAKWIPLSTTKYELTYTLINADGSVVELDDNVRTYVGATGSIADASTRTFTIDGVKYIFDEELSYGLNTKDTINAEFVTGKDEVESGVLESSDINGLVFGKFIVNGTTKLEAVYSAEKAEEVKLTAPTNVKVTDDGTVTWDAVEGAVSYRVSKVVNGKTDTGAAVKSGTEYTFKNFAEGQKHEVYVTAYDANGNAMKSESFIITPPVKVTLTAPTGVNVTNEGVVTWKASTGAVSYRVSKVVNGKTDTGKEVKTGTEYTFKNFAEGQKHEVYVTAYDANGNAEQSAIFTITPPVKVTLTAPTGVNVTNEGVVTWKASTGAVSYRVSKVVNGKTDTGATVKIGTEYTFKNFAEGQKHEVYVTAYDANGNAMKSESFTITPPKKVTLTAPKNIQIALDGSVTWTASEGASYYKVSKIVNGITYTGAKVTDATEYSFKNASADSDRKVFVTAYDEDGNSAKSDEISITAVKNMSVTKTGDVKWDAVEGASYYKVYKVDTATNSAKTEKTTYKFKSFAAGEHTVYVVAYNANGKQIAFSKQITVTAAK